MKNILVINSGSATLKFKIFQLADKTEPVEIVSGIFERIGIDNSFMEMKELLKNNFVKKNFPEGLKSHAEAFEVLIKELASYLSDLVYVGHRVVHGGEAFTEPTELNTTSLQRLKKYNRLAPLHNPVNLACAEKAMELLPNTKNFAVFDTAYYKTIPDYAYLYALPLEYHDNYGIRRYGFHGISHKYATRKACEILGKDLSNLKIVSCHLGSGASLSATLNGQAVATTMGFTPLQGLMMSTRCGDLDPAVPLFMIEELKMTPQEVDRVMNKKSGLLGIAGTMDMREILSAAGEQVTGYEPKKEFTEEEKHRAKLALKMFVYNVARYIGEYTVAMKGLDLVIFTGGIGERSEAVRQKVLAEISFMGKIESIVIPANEELMIAEEVAEKVK
ncbi:MAG: acetate/propionate family kinase [bacterium]